MLHAKSKMNWSSGLVLLILSIASLAQAQTVTFSDVNDALPGRCYNPATTLPDALNGNRLNIGVHTGIIPQSFSQSAACIATDKGPTSTMDTISFLITAPANFYISKITFTQAGSASGSRGGAGFRGATWVVDDDAITVPTTATGWNATIDLKGQNKTVIPVAITTFLAAAGGDSRSGSASASNPSVLVELAPLPAPTP